MLALLIVSAVPISNPPQAPRPVDALRVTGTVLGGVDSNADLQSDPPGVAGALRIDLELDYVHPVRARNFIIFETEAAVDAYSGESRASRTELTASLTWGRFLLGSGAVLGARRRPRRFPQLRLDLTLDYGLAVRIDGRPVPVPSAWNRADPDSDGELPPVVDDELLDVDAGLSGPALAFLRPLHDVRLRTRLRWSPVRSTRFELEPAISRVLQAGRPGAAVRHYVQTQVGVSARHRLWRGFRLEAGYQFERRDHDERLDRQDNRLGLTTHRTQAAAVLRFRRWQLWLEHRFRWRVASGGGTRTRRHTGRLEARWRVSRRWVVVARGAATFQARLDRADRDWSRLTGGLGLRVRY